VIHKLGPHCIRATGDAIDWARHAGITKALDDTTALRQGSQASVRIFRKYFATQDINRGGAPVTAEVLLALGDAPATHVELFNETAQRLGGGLERYVAFTREAVDFLHAVRPDLTLVAYCFSTGNPDRDDWEYLHAHGFGGANVIGLHSYWGNGGFTPWHGLRHRTVHAWLAGEHPPFILSEVGRDRVEGGKGGYVADGVSEDAYLAELVAFDAELMRDPYVIGATVFTAGPTPDWNAFTTDPLSGRLVALAGPLPTLPSTSTTPPSPPISAVPRIEEKAPQTTPGTSTTSPPKEAFVADVQLSVPTRATHAADGNWGKGEPFGPCRGVVLHSTGGGGKTIEAEYTATINWFANPDAGVSAHAIVGAGKFSEVCRVLGDLEKGYHAREPSNTNRRGIEVAHPDGWDGVQYADVQYEATAELIVRWWLADKARGWTWPLRVLTRTEAAADLPGIVYHRDLPAGITDGRRDPTSPWDHSRLVAAMARWQTKLGAAPPTPKPPAPVLDIAKERDALWQSAERLEKAGYPWLGQAVKAAVALSKQEQ